MMPLISIIIPCYNTASTVEETLNSVLYQSYQNWEALIVNDGSPDRIEEIALRWTIKDSRFKYFKKENGGLGSARNFGINKASGEFILPLDSDNKIRPLFVSEAVEIMIGNQNPGVVYGNAEYFGEKSGIWQVGPFDQSRLLKSNYIDACALIRKKVFYEVGLYDINFPYQGIEDWELWIRVVKNGYHFHYLNKTCFDYRVVSTSMIRSFNSEMFKKNRAYLYKKHLMFLLKTKLNSRKNNPLWFRQILRMLKALVLNTFK